jgi:chromosome partitioning protein
VPIVLCVSSLKGGVGKSTIAANLATALHRGGHRTLVVDADPQGTLRSWAAVAAEAGHDGPPVIALDGAALRRDLPRVAEGFAVVVIDAPPRLGTEARAAMLAADLVIMPSTPGAGDVWALRQTLSVFADAQGLRPELKGVAVLNRAGRTTLARMTAKALESSGVPLLDETLGDRVAFGEATLAGQGVVDYAPGSPAAREVKKLMKAVLAAVGDNR